MHANIQVRAIHVRCRRYLPKTRTFLFEGSLLLPLFCTSARIDDLQGIRECRVRHDRVRRVNFSHAARCVTRSGRHLALSLTGRKSQRPRHDTLLDTWLTSRGLRHVPQIVLIFDVLFLFCLKAIALQHCINRRRCHYYPFDRHEDIDCERASGGARVWWSRKVDRIAIRPPSHESTLRTSSRLSRRTFEIENARHEI